MTQNKEKTSTDIHWDTQAMTVDNDTDVNIHDIYQRELEYRNILPFLSKDKVALEIGCGNGFSTNLFREHLMHIDSFDYSESMVVRAISKYKQTNNTFFCDNILNPQNIQKKYDIVICVRILINLKDFSEQKTALENCSKFLKSGGILILVEGYSDGFSNLNTLREQLGMRSLIPAPINYYSPINDIKQVLMKDYRIKSTFHLGQYDYFTRIYYPLVVGEKNVRPNSEFSQAGYKLAQHHNPDCYEPYSRIRGLILQKF